MSHKGPTTSKKRKAEQLPTFGAVSEQTASTSAPSSSVYSTRVLPHIGPLPALTTLCARVFVSRLQELAKNEAAWKVSRNFLEILPDTLIPKLFAMLRATCPTVLNHAFISAYFLRGSSVTLTNDLLGVRRDTINAVVPLGATLRELELSGFSKFQDTFFASLLSNFPSLRVLVLRGSNKVGPKTAETMAKHNPHLTTVNLNYTTVTPVSLVPLVVTCQNLVHLKLAGIPNWTDATFAKFLAGVTRREDFKLNSLRTLKLRQTLLSDSSLHALVELCPSLTRLDLSFTPIRHPPPLAVVSSGFPALEKLSLTSTQLSGPDVLTVISQLSHLKTLYLGALGGGSGSTSTMRNSSAMTMTDNMLRELTDILEPFERLENISLVGNTKLGSTGKNSAKSDFILRVGKKCKKLNLAGIPSFSSIDLIGLLPEDASQISSPLEILILNNTKVDDEAAPYISSCISLEILEVAGTKFTSNGLFSIIDACPRLGKVDLTSCRGVGVRERRQFFEAWEEDRKHKIS